MDLNQILTQPTQEYLSLISLLIYFMLLLHLPYMGMVFGSGLLSTAYRKWKPDLAKDFINLALGKPRVWITFGIIPVLALAFLYKMYFFNTPIPIHLYLLRLAGLLAAGLVLLAVYRRTAFIAAGAAGTLVILIYCFHFIDVGTLLIFPEKWFYLKGPLPYPLFSITPLIHFAAFLLLSVLATGAAILFFYYRWPEKRLPENTPHFAFLKYHGFGLLLAGSLLLPVIIFWDLFNLPPYALSIQVFVLAALLIVTLFLVTAAAAVMIRNYKVSQPRYSVVAFVLALLLFGLMIGKDRTLQANAGGETFSVLKMSAEKARNKLIAEREEIYAKNMVIDAAMGEKVFNDRCTACHSFDKRILGPPFNDVLPKYEGKKDELIAFIQNPVKKDPQYPSMPNPGLTPIQVKATVKFLMEKMGMADPEENKGENQQSSE